MKTKSIFIGSTGQNVGKTTTCLGLLAGLKKRHQKVGFMKPIGQENVMTEDQVLVDKDVLLFKEVFDLQDPPAMMSPIVFFKGFTRDYLEGKIGKSDLIESLKVCFEHLLEYNQALIVEGTGHLGVGSIIDLNNAQVASILGLDMILIASGGIGSCFDQIALNKALCDQNGVRIKGIILNKVLPEKKEMVVHYMEKGLKRWDIPILGVMPYDPFLSNPTISDYASLFNTELISGHEHRIRHFKHLRLIATSNEVYQTLITPSQLIITPASREDIILTTIERHNHDIKMEGGMILTGLIPPKDFLIEKLQKANIPAFYTPTNTFNAMKMITSYTSKLKKEDYPRVHEAIELVDHHVDFSKILS